ncbi:hypothetical protein [Gracilibacillus massiliensis]|uniref:hypothetical protein n=1 Tax=Gracilibacillus massiliensis TaxID=1564956 RepID=UPI00071C5BD9|nr:hypothetical protein [Gracilibacillus massiliensis]
MNKLQRSGPMSMLIETVRFALLFFIVPLLLLIPTYFVLSMVSINAENYLWTAMIIGLIIIFVLYRRKRWGQGVIQLTSFLFAIGLVMVTSLFIPDPSPSQIHTEKYAYNYGFPFEYVTIYTEDGEELLILNLLSQEITGASVSPGLFVNFIIFYIAIFLINKYVIKESWLLMKPLRF